MKLFKKHTTALLLLGIAALGVQSCDLDEYNPSGEGAEAVYATPQGIKGLVNQLYYNFRWKYYGREDPVLYMEGSADIWQNIATRYAYGNHNTRYVGLQGSQCGQTNNAWKRVYDNINVANNILKYLDTATGLTEEERADFEGEARAMRAYCYWWLCEMFGDIELRTEPTESAIFEAHRTDRTVIYDEVIIPDAQIAAEKLPVKPYNDNIGRLTKKSAYGILARTCLARVQYENSDAGKQKYYQMALDAANYVINNRGSLGISLYKTYDEIWQAKNNKTNSEFLWVCSHSSIPDLNPQKSNPNRLHSYFTPNLIDRCGISSSETNWDYPKENDRMAPTYYFMNLWKPWDARYAAVFQEEFKETGSRGYTWTEEMRANYDAPASIVGKRAAKGAVVMNFVGHEVTDAEKETAASKGIVLLGTNDLYNLSKKTTMGGAPLKNVEAGEVKTYVASSFPRFNKYRIWDGDEKGTILLQGANTNVGFADVPIMRFAEMPLIAAECYIGLNQKAQAVDVIKKYIRNERVVGEGYTLSDVQADVTEANMTVDWIIDERARELCGEWLRWFDIKRVYSPQGKFSAVIRGRNPSMIGDDCVEEFNALWPIPNDYLDKVQNWQDFGQNPGYNPYSR